jgi:hypothetical protein
VKHVLYTSNCDLGLGVKVPSANALVPFHSFLCLNLSQCNCWFLGHMFGEDAVVSQSVHTFV